MEKKQNTELDSEKNQARSERRKRHCGVKN